MAHGAVHHADTFKTRQDDSHNRGTGPNAPTATASELYPGAAKHQIDLSVPSRPARKTDCAPGISRKEVIQPQVLLQLPCYDFTPITNHTLGTCLPCGLAQRLLVQPAFVM